jgi:hypothetical protein
MSVATMHKFNTAGRRDGPMQSTAAPSRTPTGQPTGSGENHKPGSARPHEGSGGTRDMAQSSVTNANPPLHGTGHLPGTSLSHGSGDRIKP